MADKRNRLSLEFGHFQNEGTLRELLNQAAVVRHADFTAKWVEPSAFVRIYLHSSAKAFLIRELAHY
jgi:hypothetical protein